MMDKVKTARRVLLGMWLNGRIRPEPSSLSGYEMVPSDPISLELEDSMSS